jgi:hypothetical protein
MYMPVLHGSFDVSVDLVEYTLCHAVPLNFFYLKEQRDSELYSIILELLAYRFFVSINESWVVQLKVS